MRKIIFPIIFLTLVLSANATNINVTNTSLTNVIYREPNPPSALLLKNMRIKEAEKLLGRKMKLKEKIAFKIFQHKLKKKYADEPGNNGVTSMVLGIAGLAAMFIPYVQIAAIPCLILALIFGYATKKKFPKDKNAKTGIILGWIGVGLIVIAIGLLFSIIASL